MVETGFVDIYAKGLFFIVDNFKTKIANLSFINEEVLDGLKEKGVNNFPDEFMTSFKDLINANKLYEHTQIEKPLEQINLIKDDENNVSTYYKEEYHELVVKIKKYCFYLCKTFKENQELLETIDALEIKKNHDFLNFLYIIKDLKDIFLAKFQTTAEEKLKWEEDLEQLKKEEIKLQEEEIDLNKKLKEIRIENQKELTKLNNTFTKKENELNDLKKHSEENISNLMNMIPKDDTSHELESINMLFEKTKNLYENQLRMHQDKEISSIKKNSLLEVDIKNYIDSIDAEIKQKDEEIEKLQMELEKNRLIEKDLDSILIKKKMDEEEKQYLSELATQRKKIMQREEEKNSEAAIVIQSYIRAIKQRTLFAEHQKKTGKKNKKKGINKEKK